MGLGNAAELLNKLVVEDKEHDM